MENINESTYLKNIGRIYFCEQCGRCTSVCPITGIDDFNIRQFIRCVETYQKEELLGNSMPWLCLTCGRCEEACPNGINILELVRFVRRLLPKETIPSIACIEACPVGINIPGFIRMVSEGKNVEALELITQKAPMPGVLGRVCSQPCESNCRRGRIDSPVSICNLKRYLSDSESVYLNKIYKPSCKETKKKVLIIGSGPCGLSAAYYLRKKGHSVTILEKKNKAGGMLRYGIPAYRLPKSVLDSEIDRIISMGVDLRTNIDLGNIVDEHLFKKNFDAILIAVGLQSSHLMSFNKDSMDGIMLGLDFLNNVNSQSPPKLGNNILVIGGGNVAIDVAMSAVRLGAKNVILACLEKDQEEMPADKVEIKTAIDEGIKILNAWGFNRFLGDSLIAGVELINCVSVIDECGNFNPKFGKNKIVLNIDQIIISIGQTCDKNSLKKISFFLNNNLKMDDFLIQVDSKNRLVANIFAGGDVIYGPKSVASAIASGRRVASSIDKFLGGNGVWPITKIDTDVNKRKKFDVSKSYIKRQLANKLAKNKRVNCFSEINCGLSHEQVGFEASRCLECDIEYKLT